VMNYETTEFSKEVNQLRVQYHRRFIYRL
jgi:hypothetical protein